MSEQEVATEYVMTLTEVLAGVGIGPGQLAGHACVTGTEPAIDSPHRLAGAMAIAACGQGAALAALHHMHGGPRQDVTVAIGAAAHAIHPSRYLKQCGHPIGFDFTYAEPGNGYFRTRDGRHCYLVSTRPQLRNDLLKLLDCANDAQKIARAVADWNGAELEEACIAAALPVSLVRSPEEWRAHPHGVRLHRQPLIEIERIDDAPPMRRLAGPRPLSELRVLDLSHILAGPGLARTLAEQGANVLRLSAPRQTDPINFMLDTGFGKRTAFVDIDVSDQLAHARALAREADVVVQSYRPGSLARRGLDAETLAARHPGLVYVSVSCYGDCGGPWSGRVGFDHNAQSSTGISWVEGGADTPRLPPTTLVADYITAYLGTLGALAALMRRREEGGSYHVKVSLARTCMWVQDLGLLSRPRAVQAIAPKLARMDSPFGMLEYLAPITQYSRTPAAWATPPLPLGASAAAW